MHVLVDNTVLANFIDAKDFDVFALLRSNLVFTKLVIPEGVKIEFANCPKEKFTINRSRFLLALEKTGPSFYELCTSYDPVIFAVLESEPNIHKGEAELIAQCMKRHISTILTDDRACLAYLREHYPEVRLYTSNTLVALLDLHGAIGNGSNYLKFILYCKDQFGLTRKALKEAYELAYQSIGARFNKKYVQKRLYQDAKIAFSNKS